MTTFRRPATGQRTWAAPAMSVAAATNRWSAQDDRELKPSVERDGRRRERRVGLPGARVRAEGVLVGQDVVGHDQRARLELAARELEEPLVVLLLRVEEADVEDVVDRRQRLVGVALDEVGPVLEPRVGDVPPPRLDLRRVALEREDAAAEMAHARREPDRGVAARAAELEHLAVGL